MGNSVSLPALPLTEFDHINSFFGTRKAVKWLQMIFPACICCVETSKNNHPLLAGEIILAKPLIHTKLCQWKSAAAFINLADAILGRWRSVGGRGFPSAGVHVRRRSGRGWCSQAWYMHHHDNTKCWIHPPWMFLCAYPTQSSRVRQQVSTQDVLRTTGSGGCSNLGPQAAVLKFTPTSSLPPSSPG